MLKKLKPFKLTQKNFVPLVLSFITLILIVINSIQFGFLFGLLYTVITVLFTVGLLFVFDKITQSLPRD